MIRPNFWRASLLDASGELSKTAKNQLLAHLARHPEEQPRHDAIHHAFEQLQALPPVKLTETESRTITGRIKRTIHKKLRERQGREIAQRRWKMIYHGMAGAAAMAACLLIVFSANHVYNEVQQNRRQALAKAEDNVQAFVDTGQSNVMDVAYENMALAIDDAGDRQRQFNNGELVRTAMLNLAEDATDVLELEVD